MSVQLQHELKKKTMCTIFVRHISKENGHCGEEIVRIELPEIA
jgi:hypothetical protein